MASPFTVFRRNRKSLLVALTILAMFAFVIGDQIIRLMGVRSAQKAVFVSTKRYGNLSVPEVQELVTRRGQLLAIVGGIRDAVGKAGGRGDAATRLYRQLGGDQRQVDAQRSAVQVWLLAHYAQDMGFVVSDDAISDYVVELTENRLSSEVLRGILRRQQSERRGTVTEIDFYNMLRDELLALRLEQTTLPVALSFTPGQQWDYFKRLKQQAYVELLALPVRNYADQVKEPDEATLKEFFEKYRNQPWPPFSPEPGFKTPQQAKIGYVRADIDALAKEITDAEILTQYESDRERYDRDTRVNLGAPSQPTDKKSDIPKPDDTPKSDEKPSAEKGDAKKPAEEPKPDTPKPEEKPADAPKPEEKPADATKPADKPAEPKDAPKEKESPKEEESSALRRGLFQFAAMAEEKATEEESSKPSEEKKEPADAPKTEAAPADAMDDAPKPEAPKDEMPADKPADAKPEETRPADAAKPDEKPVEPKPDEAKPAEPTRSTPPGTGVKTGPTDAIKDRIRTELAVKKIDALFAQVAGRLSQYKTAQINYKTKDAPPDFDQFAKENRLTFVQTELLPMWGLYDSELANVLPETGDNFLQTVFGRSTFVPTQGRKFGARFTLDAKYIWWTVEEVKEHTPKWGDSGIHERTLDAWKLVEARSVARKAAEGLAAEARKSGKPLKEAFADRADVTVFDPPRFSWMTTDSVGTMTMGKVEQVDTPGQDFMRVVFDLGRRDVGVAMNQPQTFAYVVRAVDFSPSEKLLWDMFITTEHEDYHYRQMAQQDAQQMLADWQRKIEEYAGLKWEQTSMRGSTEGE